jgi:drug/metabolite transporter (DMT)-like permease
MTASITRTTARTTVRSMSRTQALFSVHLVGLLFGTCGILGELIEADASVITWGRAACAIVVLSIVSRVASNSGIRGLLAHGRWCALIVSGTMLAIHWATFFISVKVGGIAVATLGFASFPAFITLIEWGVLRERVTRAEWIRLICVTFGLILVTPSFDFSDAGTEGLLWGLFSGAGFGVLAVLNRRYLSNIDAFYVAGLQNSVVFLLLSPWALPLLPAVSLASWGWILVLGVACTGLAHLLFVASLRVLHARTAGLVVALEPVYAIVFAWILFAQVPTMRTIAGGVIMIAAILSASLAVRKV